MSELSLNGGRDSLRAFAVASERLLKSNTFHMPYAL